MSRRLLLAAALAVLGLSAGWRSASAQEQGASTAPPAPQETTTTTVFHDPTDDLRIAPDLGGVPSSGGPRPAPTAPAEAKKEDPKPSTTSTTWSCADPDNWALPTTGGGGFPSIPGECWDPTKPTDLEQFGSGDDGGGWLWGPIRRVLDKWFLSLARAALNPILDLLADTVFATPDVTVPGTVRDYWVYSLVLADTVLVLLVVIAGLVLMGHETVQTRTTVKEVAPRLLFAVVAAHTSLGFAGMLIRAANALSAGFLGDFNPKSGHMATEGLFHIVLGVIARGNIFLAILGIAVAALGIGVLCTYLARVANIVVLVGAAPLFLIAHAVPQLEGAARLWWRNLIGCLGIQVCQSLMMSATLRVFFHDDGSSLAGMPGGGLMDLLLVGSLFFLMLRIPSYAGRLIFAPRSSNTITQQVGSRVVPGGIGAVTRAAS